VQGDDATLVEPLENQLLRASFASGDDGAALLLATLESAVLRHRVLALRGLVRQSLMSPELWRHVLNDDDVEMRREALQQIAHATLDGPSVLQDVVALLSDDDALVVDAAVFALGEHLYVDAVVELCGVAQDHKDARCRESAIAALGAIGDERGRVTILLALNDKPAIRRRAIVALSNFEGPDVEAALDAAGEDRDWQVRSAVTQLRKEES
jgi:HEAT repeat protein